MIYCNCVGFILRVAEALYGPLDRFRQWRDGYSHPVVVEIAVQDTYSCSHEVRDRLALLSRRENLMS